MSEKKKDSFYRITYREPQDGQIVSIKAHNVTDSTLGLSFVSISDFYFDDSSLVVNPAEEDLKKHFADVKTLHLSIYTIVSIEEVGFDTKGLAFKKDKSNLVVLPTGDQTPKGN